MIRLLLIALLLAAAPRAALSQDGPGANAPRLKELVAVTGEVVLIGDLFENAGPVANIAVFRAPDLGETGAVDVNRIVEALKPHRVVDVDTAGLRQVVVTRLSRAITAAEIEQRLVYAFAGHYGFGEARNLSVSTDRTLRALHVEAAVTGELAVARLNFDPRNGRFDVSFELPGSAAARRAPLRVTGVVSETVEATVLMRPLARGETVKHSDVMIERRRKSELLAGAIVADQALGQAAKRPLRPGDVLRAADLMKPEVIRRNETVTIIYQVPGIVLTVRGKALETGSIGDMISVTNIQTNRTIQAAVEAPGRVTVAPPMPLIASAAPVLAPPAPSGEEPETPRTQ